MAEPLIFPKLADPKWNASFKSYAEATDHALKIVGLHLREENPEDIEHCMSYYTDDVIWEIPGRGIQYTGKQSVKENYLRLFQSAEGIAFDPIERIGTPERVIDDMWVRFRLSGDGFTNAPVPIGTRVKMRLVHNFYIRDGLIAREIGYEMWRRDE